MFLRADREGDIDRGLARSGRGRDTDRKRERGREKKDVEGEREREEDRERIRSERDGVSQPEECLSWQWFWDRLDSVESGQSSRRQYSSPRCILFRVFFGALRCASSPPLRARLFLSISILFSRCQTSLAHEIYFHPPITPTPKGTRARAQTRCVELVRSLHHQRIRMSVVSRSRQLPRDFCKR